MLDPWSIGDISDEKNQRKKKKQKRARTDKKREKSAKEVTKLRLSQSQATSCPYFQPKTREPLQKLQRDQDAEKFQQHLSGRLN